MPATLINDFPEPAEARRPAPVGRAAASALNPDADDVVQLVLQMLRERMGMDVVFVSQFGDLPTGPAGTAPLNIPIVLRDGRIHGMLCCLSFSSSQAIVERDLRSLRYSARLAARLLDNIQILRDLARRSAHH
jgi:hypothetical protein